MKNGIYVVKFRSSMQDFGGGIVVVKDGSINGGDFGYIYYGKVSSDGNSISGDFSIKQWERSAVSVFGPMSEFVLALNGTQDPASKSISLRGSMKGQPQLSIEISGTFLTEGA